MLWKSINDLWTKSGLILRTSITIWLFFLVGFYSSFAQNCILNSNDRTEVVTNRKENSFIAHIVVYRNFNRTFDATVSFISPNVIIGAGHSFREKFYTKIKKIELYIGQRNTETGNTYLAKRTFKRDEITIWVDPIFQKKGNPENDYALVSLNRNSVNEYFNLLSFDDALKEIDTVQINGYPGDKGNKELWNKRAAISNIQSFQKIIVHNMFTYTGDSGAPIWTKINDKYVILGVHGTGHYKNGSCNAGIKLTEHRIKHINSFILKHKIID